MFMHSALLRRSISASQFSRFKHSVDYSKFPVLNENDLEEMHVRGTGPGGQKVNKTSNCVVLKHIPTGILVKCHESRSLPKNQEIARSHLLTKIDNFLNGENSVEAQLKALQDKKDSARKAKKEKLKLLKEKWKEREKES
ncbi:mitochondrial translation release factor in rescue [Leptinotarsa decemlineata]|uniref:mitochondrial translation release factor in rescue n=1 Tax=Leptinotarsa decemlineata TaxID=7539 RepID=UPI000C253922|nr:probable peptide chain release factor C12orf65, mitochondrial [Leptinotarsa decemlineata]XP_023018624.1 probable peptide chain release factor C12orf65, mitochondrial [Leptinotarsa decemlineata]